jgi:hypothetical protein
MENNKYNDEPVEYCLACNSLHIVYEEDNNAVLCMNCGAMDFTAMAPSIDKYLKMVGDGNTKDLPC